MASLYTPHERALGVLFADITNQARQLHEVLIGTPGSVIIRANARGVRYYVHQYYDGERKQRERYLAGPVGKAEAEAAADSMRDRIAETRDIVPSLRMLAREGYNVADPLTYATLATLFNHGVFDAGGVLVGSHAYSALLNHLGIRGTPWATEDIDARPNRLAFPTLPELGFLEMLRESGIDFLEVPGLRRGEPATSFKRKGRARLHVDLLVPSTGEDFSAVPVPELKAHATALPHLGYLLAEAQPGVVLSRVGVCPVRLPLPERFATHKLVVSQLRTGRDAKVEKDISQACVLADYLAREHPGALTEAVEALSPRTLALARRGLRAAQTTLEPRASLAWIEWSDALDQAGASNS